MPHPSAESSGLGSQALECSGAVIGRILLSHIFLLSGALKMPEWSKTQDEMRQEFGRFFGWLGAPQSVNDLWGAALPVLLAAATACELGGGLSLLLGYRARWGALVLFLFLVPTTLLFH